MVLWPILRSVTRYSRGKRPRLDDLNAIVRYLRRRRERGLPVLSLEKLGRLPALSRGDPAQKLEALQTRKLKATVEYAYRYVPFYRQAMDSLGVKAGDIRTLADVHKLPITRREQLSENTEAFISHYPGLVATTVSWTGGTTGKRIQAYLTSDEFEFYTASEALGALLTGTFGPADILQIHFTMDRAIEDLEQGVGLIYRQMGRKGLESIENVGPRLAEVVEDLLDRLRNWPTGGLAPANSTGFPEFPFETTH